MQAIILSLVGAGNAGKMQDEGREVSRVYRFFEAHAFLNARRATQLGQGLLNLRGLAALPYSPALESVACPPIPSRGLCAMLSSYSHLTPHLTKLELESDFGVPWVVAALANNTQLRMLTLALDDDETTPDSEAPQQPVPQLPQLPALLDLDFRLSVTGDAAASGIPLGLTNLSGMTQLTRLQVNVFDRRWAADDEPYVVTAMRPVAHALGALTALRTLTLVGWSCDPCPAAHACWQAMAEALPRMQHLTEVNLNDICLLSNFDPSHFQTLSAGLARLPSLQSLVICSDTWDPVVATAEHLTASEHLATAIGALTSLQSLWLSSLCPLLQEHDCYVHLRGLTGLTHLMLERLASGLQPGVAEDVGQALVSMLAGMTRLRSLRVGAEGHLVVAVDRMEAAQLSHLNLAAGRVLFVSDRVAVALNVLQPPLCS